MGHFDEKKLINGALNLGISLTQEQVDQFRIFAELLEQSSKKFNLTTVPAEEYIARHFLDSLSITRLIQGKTGVKLADIGSGAGFPGIPIKIAFPDIQLTIVESLSKRCSFLKKVSEQLEFEEVEILHTRGEVTAHAGHYRECFDFVTARALADLRILSEIMLAYLKIDGFMLALKSENIELEIKGALKTIEVCGGEFLQTDEIYIPDLKRKSSVVVVKKVSLTPKKYPRSYAALSKRGVTS